MSRYKYTISAKQTQGDQMKKLWFFLYIWAK